MLTSEKFEFTVLMPCLNEQETIGLCIQKAKQSIQLNGLSAEILVADNGSTDNSIAIAHGLGARVFCVEKKGYGNTLRAGIENAKGKFVIMADSDDSYDFNDLLPFIYKLREGYDLVVGNRFKGGIEARAMPFLHRYLGNPVLTNIGKLFFKIPLGDFHCGFRAVNRQAILDINLSSTGMEFASEMIVKSSLNHQRIAEVSVRLYLDGRSRPPHLRTWHDGWRHLRFLLIHSPKWLFLYPGIFLLGFGIIITSLLLPNPIRIGTVKFDVHTMLYSAVMIIIGTQMITFFFYSKIFSIKMGFENNENWLNRFNKVFSLEKGLIIGLVMLLLGVSLTIGSVIVWNNKLFGDLQPSLMLRVIIPAIVFLVLGVQLVFNSFFACILSVGIK